MLTVMGMMAEYLAKHKDNTSQKGESRFKSGTEQGS
jgi:hypothetical protein